MSSIINIDSITFSDNTTVRLGAFDIVVFVGPNNAGKTVALNDIYGLGMSTQHHPLRVVKAISILRSGALTDLFSWLEANCKTKRHPSTGQRYFERNGGGIPEHKVQNLWATYNSGLFELGSMFSNFVSAEARLQASNPPQQFSVTEETPQHPIQHMARYEDIERRISSYFKRAFGVDLIVHRNAGGSIPLYCGVAPRPPAGKDRLSIDYLSELEKLPKLHEQGHGMKSFVGCLMHSTVCENFLTFIDEPEAFLHPPQASMLGKILAESKSSNGQLFLATHSGDFLRGLLSAENAPVRIIRIRREGDINVARELQPEDLRNVWKDPLLRHSNLLDALFHETAIVCEGDSDCRFYSAVLSAIVELKDTKQPDAMFLHCGGKGRVPMVARALKALDVPVAVIVDIDALSDERPIRDIWEALGGPWAELEDDWRVIKSAIDGLKPTLNAAEICSSVRNILDKVSSSSGFPAKSAQEIREQLKKGSPWQLLKKIGASFIPAGGPSQAFQRLVSNAASRNLHIVHVGELEGFDRTVGRDGPQWVSEVVYKDLGNAAEFEAARSFVKRLVNLPN